MTGNDIFEAAAAYVSQTREQCEELAELVPIWLNLLLEESLPYENCAKRCV